MATWQTRFFAKHWCAHQFWTRYFALYSWNKGIIGPAYAHTMACSCWSAHTTSCCRQLPYPAMESRTIFSRTSGVQNGSFIVYLLLSILNPYSFSSVLCKGVLQFWWEWSGLQRQTNSLTFLLHLILTKFVGAMTAFFFQSSLSNSSILLEHRSFEQSITKSLHTQRSLSIWIFIHQNHFLGLNRRQLFLVSFWRLLRGAPMFLYQ